MLKSDWTALVAGESSAPENGSKAIPGEDRSTGQIDTIPGNTGTTASIDPSSTTSSIQTGFVNTPGDADWYRMPVVAGTRYTIILSGFSSTSGGGPALPFALVRVYDEAGQLIGTGSPGFNNNSSFQLTATTTGAVYVSAEGANGATGRYSTLVVTTAAPAPDTVPGDTSTTAGLTVGGSVDGLIDVADDTDWFRIELEAGRIYDFSLNATSTSLDPLLQLRGANGALLAENDDGGEGLDSLLTYMPTVSGTYYLSAADYSDGTGGYRLSAALGTTNDIKATLDWGARIEGNVVEVYFIPAGETHDGKVSAGWNDYEISRAMAAMAGFSAVTSLSFVRVDNPLQADFRLMTSTGLDEFEFGYFFAPGGPNAGLGVFSRTAPGWDEAGGGGLEFGGLGFVTLVHEIGHGLGLAHPHDTGGRSLAMTGVNAAFDSLGLFDLNQGVFTTLGYNDGWLTGPDGPTPSESFGLQAGPMALDIAVLQAKYGANSSFRTGDDLYLLPAADGLGVGFLSIWDAGGVDTIEHRGASAAVIDLRSATIDYSATGGGVVSHARGVHGGFTIAAGAVIENAVGGSGADQLRGNAAGNFLSGRDGDDIILGGDGGDHMIGGAGIDAIRGEAGDDLAGGQDGDDFIDGGAGRDTLYGDGGRDHIVGGAENDGLFGQDGDDLIGGQDGEDYIDGGAGLDRLYGDAGADHMVGGGERDELFGGDGDDLIGGQDGDDFVDGGAGRDRLYGDGGGDHMVGGADNDGLFGLDGDDLIGGQDGDDFIDGGAGRDRLYGDGGGDHMVGGGERDDLFGGDGDDLIGGQDGDDYIDGGSGRDRLYGDAGSDHIVGGGDDDALFGQDGDDLMGGQDGADLLEGGAGRDLLYGDAGDDRLAGGAGDDRLDGGAGFDTAVFAGARSAYTVTAGAGYITVTGLDGTDTLFGIERLQFGDMLLPIVSPSTALEEATAPTAPDWMI